MQKYCQCDSLITWICMWCFLGVCFGFVRKSKPFSLALFGNMKGSGLRCCKWIFLISHLSIRRNWWLFLSHFLNPSYLTTPLLIHFWNALFSWPTWSLNVEKMGWTIFQRWHYFHFHWRVQHLKAAEKGWTTSESHPEWLPWLHSTKKGKWTWIRIDV